MAQQNAGKPVLTADLEARLAELQEAHEAAIRETSFGLLRQKTEIEALKWQIELARIYAIPETSEMPKPAPLPRLQGGKPTEHVHPMTVALGNVKEWCRRTGVQYPRARQWYEGSAPIPRRWAIYFEKKYQIPASAWKGGISDHPLAGLPKDKWPAVAKPRKRTRKSA